VRWDDPTYPAALRVIADPPRTVYVRGTLRDEDKAAVAIVGSRRASAYGVAVAERLGRELASCGVTVVSGLARGVDAAGHRGALAGGGRTIAVLGCGVDVVYPPEHRRLMAQIIEAGAVVSEFPPGTPPLPHHFPQRNRLISGLGLGVVVVEGRERSGALLTADCALEQGREVFAVPGSIFDETSRTPHRLLQQGAKLVARVEDILDELGLAALRPLSTAVSPVRLEGVEAEVHAQLGLQPQHPDALALRCRLPVAEVSRALTVLEVRGLVRGIHASSGFLRRAPVLRRNRAPDLTRYSNDSRPGAHGADSG
jgi:DNA processing protein